MTARARFATRVAELSLERPEGRAGAALALVVLTLISPYVPLPGTLPAVRLEQVLLLLLVGPLIAFHMRHAEHRGLGIIDLAFGALAVATALTITLTPFFVSTASRSPRDIFELAWIGQLWIIYRLGRTIEAPQRFEARLSQALAVSALALGGFALLQFLNPPGFNSLITAIWTQTHNLLGVEREGRVVGTAGNANQFGILATMLLVVAIAALVDGAQSTRARDVRAGLLRGAIIAATVGIVLSQSRGAVFAAVLALFAGLVLSIARRQARRALIRGLPPILLGAVLAVLVMVAAPPQSGSVLRRFDPIAIVRDPSLIIRLGRIQSLIATDPRPTPGGDDPAGCLESLVRASPAPGHEPGVEAPPLPDVGARDDVASMAAAIGAYYCRTGSWPTGNLQERVVHDEIGMIPNDPETGRPYAVYVSDRGFAVGRTVAAGSPVEDDQQALGRGSLPNLLQNPSFESGAQVPTTWLFTPGVSLTRAGDAGAVFGASVGAARMPKGGAVYQLVVADLPMSTEYVAGAWLRSAPGADATVQLYVVAITGSGRRVDPLAASTLVIPGDGAWHHALLRLQTPDERLTFLQVMLRSPDGRIDIDLDGVSLTEGPVARAFELLVEGDAAAGTRDAVLRESPILGLGPQKDSRGAAYDNEYVTFIAHYGLLGLGAYLFLFLAAAVEGSRLLRRNRGWPGVYGVILVATTIALFAFAVSAGAYRQLQVMLPFWLGAGLVVASRVRAADGEDSSSSPGT